MQNSIDQIYQNGRHYDLLMPSGSEPPHFWLTQAERYGGPMLELACGTGRVALAVAEQGLAVTGIDYAPSMLAEAQRKAALGNIPIKLLAGDMRNFELGKRFALIILPNNTLCHLHTLADFKACMACVRRHLLPAGRFIVEVFVPNLDLLLQEPEERVPFSEYDDPDGGGKIVVTASARYDAAAQIRYNTTYYKFPNRADEVSGELTMRMFFPQELDALFHYNGLRIEHKYGGQDESPFTADSHMQIFVLQ
jgi:SAM-dependent methyltransferase